MNLLSLFSLSFARFVMRFAVLLFAIFFSKASYSADVTTNGFKLLLDGKKMVIKGMNYSPVPIGAKPENQPYGDYFVLNYRNVWKPDLLKAGGSPARQPLEGSTRSQKIRRLNLDPPGPGAPARSR